MQLWPTLLRNGETYLTLFKCQHRLADLLPETRNPSVFGTVNVQPMMAADIAFNRSLSACSASIRLHLRKILLYTSCQEAVTKRLMPCG